MPFQRSDVTLANWRTSPYSQWSFQNVNEIVPSAVIAADRQREEASLAFSALSGLEVAGANGDTLPLEAFLRASETDELVVMRQGRIVAEWCATHRKPAQPHIIFSVSKSLMALLAGALAGKGLLSHDRPILDYVPEVSGSAYADATVQQLFDMEISTNFIEDYLDSSGGFDRYRRATGWNPDRVDDPAPDLKSFICTIGKGDGEHGEKHAYRSPDTDLAGIVLERAGSDRFAALMSQHLWKPLGAKSDAMVTVDRIGTARAAGGISATARDLALVGELVRTGGGGIVPDTFIADLWTGGNRSAWKNGDQTALFPDGSYRNYWYETGGGELAAIGIHGQWIWVDPRHETVIVTLSSQTLPVDASLDQAIIRMLRAVALAG
ncbi:class C beta-lactamase-related serine hydrolase [Neorhizobium lilium]|uniref:Class C beta-lactamase-related serine hydrolase n=1 Tax=Neorhizobium lilium TaxID=2503024 RepID=A0A3S3T3A0_9HYPH|nr:serine hydrolase [Neorhizobium lilium]RWX81103.1 class C beta-lactamase-related serine hydrolase [Neorhizobium lilium]